MNEQREKRKKSDAQEARWADLVGGTVSKGSGSGWRKPQDVRSMLLSDSFLWECKGTDGKSVSLKQEWWEQLHRNAAMEGCLPAMHIELRGGNVPRRFVVIDEDTFLMKIGG